MNFVERRKLREDHLAHARDLWDDARTKIEECCESYKKYYRTIGEVDCSAINGNSIKVVITFTGGQNPPPAGVVYPKKVARIVFNEAKLSVNVTVDSGTAKDFKINADEGRCFLTYAAKEIDLDEFAKQALHDAFFTIPPEPGPMRSTPGGGPQSWMS